MLKNEIGFLHKPYPGVEAYWMSTSRLLKGDILFDKMKQEHEGARVHGNRGQIF